MDDVGVYRRLLPFDAQRQKARQNDNVRLTLRVENSSEQATVRVVVELVQEMWVELLLAQATGTAHVDRWMDDTLGIDLDGDGNRFGVLGIEECRQWNDSLIPRLSVVERVGARQIPL